MQGRLVGYNSSLVRPRVSFRDGRSTQSTWQGEQAPLMILARLHMHLVPIFVPWSFKSRERGGWNFTCYALVGFGGCGSRLSLPAVLTGGLKEVEAV